MRTALEVLRDLTTVNRRRGLTGDDLDDLLQEADALLKSYADAPLSLGEARAERENSGAVITPRETLISLLREIDAGKVVVDGCVICLNSPGDVPNSTRTHYRNATKSAYEALGLLSRVNYKINGGL